VNCDTPLTGRQVYYCSDFCSLKAYNNPKLWKVDSWTKIRLLALDRDGGKCVKCGAVAVEVDHIVEIAIGGPEFDLDNLQSLCVPCHKEKTRKFNSRKRV
jgi:5-methylcytosine-specific restriction endonuclease McrA